MIKEEIRDLIKLAIADGKITKQERSVILKKAKALGDDVDEVEMILDAELIQKNEKLGLIHKNHRSFKMSKKLMTTLIVLGVFLILATYTKVSNHYSDITEKNEWARNAAESTAETESLENIESKIIIGIQKGQSKEELLVLVSKLKSSIHRRADGLKNNIIEPDKRNEEYDGSYSSYCTKKRGIYKEIIMDGISIEEYLNNNSPKMKMKDLLKSNKFDEAESLLELITDWVSKKEMKEELLSSRFSYYLKSNQIEKAYQSIQSLRPKECSFSEIDYHDGSGSNSSWNDYANLYNSNLDQIVGVYIEKRLFEKARAIATSYKGNAKITGPVDPEKTSYGAKYKYELDNSHKNSKVAEIQIYIKQSHKVTSIQPTKKTVKKEKVYVTLNNTYLGLYIFQSEEGNTRFYKFIKNPTAKAIKVLYQDNLSGTVKMENFLLTSFVETTGEVVIKGEKNKNDKVKLIFRKDPDSNNGFKLMDTKGVGYTFVSH
ncbi:hypothetical protein ACXR6G_18290 [Ancylomarina sp. YFZ004]